MLQTDMKQHSAPRKPVANYITPEGEQAMKQELATLWRIERPQVTQSVADAAALGDRSENAEYIYGKKRLREIDRRVRFLRKRLEVLQVVRQLPGDQDKIYFGAWVSLVDEDNHEYRYRLVGPDEIDPAKNHISIDSPMGKALLGKRVGDEVLILSPSGQRHYEILHIRYERLMDSP
jgi:transcription elongation factor GreB